MKILQKIYRKWYKKKHSYCTDKKCSLYIPGAGHDFTVKKCKYYEKKS